MRFTINLATRTYLDHRLVNRIFALCILALLGVLAWNVIHLSWTSGDLRRLRSENASMESRLNARPADVSEKDFNRLLTAIRFYNRLIEQKTYDWLGLLDRLESATPEGVSLVSLVPDSKGELKIEGRARSFAQVRTYMEKLEDSKDFGNILLLSHRDLLLGEKSRGVQFSISCTAVKR